MKDIDIDAFEARAAEAEQRLAALEQRGTHASSGTFTQAMGVPAELPKTLAPRLQLPQWRAGTSDLPEQLRNTLHSIKADLLEAKAERAKVSSLPCTSKDLLTFVQGPLHRDKPGSLRYPSPAPTIMQMCAACSRD